VSIKANQGVHPPLPHPQSEGPPPPNHPHPDHSDHSHPHPDHPHPDHPHPHPDHPHPRPDHPHPDQREPNFPRPDRPRPDQREQGNTPPMHILATIESIATGTPYNVIPQAAAAKVVANLPNLEENRHRIEKLYANTRIETRHLALDLLSDDAIAFTRTSTIHDRMQMYQDHAIPLAERVVRKALESAVSNAQSIEVGIRRPIEELIRLIVFVSSTGFVAPGIDTEVIKRLGLRRDIARVTVNFMGCAAAMNGLRIASDHVRAHPTHKVLVVCLELSSVNAVFEDDVNDLIIHSLFGDGCAVVVIGACEEDQAIHQGKFILRDHLSYLVADTEDGITLGIQDNGVTCELSKQLPDYIEAAVNPIIEQFLSKHRLTKNNIDLWAVHPGGTRIIEKSQRSLGLSDAQVADSWEILRQYGNMLSTSVLFVIERMLRRSEEDSRKRNAVDHARAREPDNAGQDIPKHALTGIAFSFSPGVGVEGLLFQKF
jgi:alpha-pyrone synthase